MAGTKKAGTKNRPATKREPRAGSGSPQRTRLRVMLSEAAGQINEEGLLFLLRQANTLIHNQKVDEVNRELAELPSTPGRSSAGRAGRRPQPLVTVDDPGDRSAIFLTLGGTRKVLNLAELKQLVRICYAAETKTDALRQLYTVLARERSDILKDAGIGNAANPLVEGLFHALREKYRLEDR